ncbi:MAG TPA: hypothetical protein VK988_01240 [Acidimicrobiales bacterium]|nr:hypothetical protein [Acidimicrobiales bacterium]
MTTPATPPYWVEPLYGIQQSVQEMGEAASQALSEADRIAREISKRAVQETSQPK